MDLELVNRLAEVLVLDEGDGPVLPLNKVGIEEGKKRMDLCLVGKVIGPRPANRDGIEKAMKGVWKINHRFQVEELSSKNVFRFFFGSREDRQRVFGGGPWTIDKQLICFVKPFGLGEISKMNFEFTSFWILINNVPLASEQLAPTSVLEARERDEEVLSHANAEKNSVLAAENHLAMDGAVLGGQIGIDGESDKGMLKSTSPCSGKCDGGPVHDNGHVEIEVMLPDRDKGKVVSGGECSLGRDFASSSVDVIMEDEGVMIDQRKQQLIKDRKGKGVMGHSDHDEITFSHALQHTFEPLIKAQKSKTWKRLNSSYGRGSKGVSKVSAMPISPKLSHILVANATFKTSPKVGGGGKRKMEKEVERDRQCFTWLNKRQGVAHVQERLDRYFCNQEWHSLYPSFKVINGNLIHSDHRPVVASLENVVRLKQQDNQRRFRFETHWLKDDECHDIVDQTWLTPDAPLDSQDSILDIFGRCADRLGAWNKLFSSASPSVQQVENGITHIEGRVSSEECEMDPWLPQPRTFRPISPAPGGTVMVSDLIGGQGSWDVGSLSRYFMQAGIDIILVLGASDTGVARLGSGGVPVAWGG
ncbi:hypothetical protein F8388_008824 [Cannabis sativa]|uniref:DUF4283 domain-containing protein n=1 Tax=Cannabis sativa TaxID=3483 RepID=A0A7J6GXY0_CANSA|nr:hypothetical protein F8388_008824 [Cannabis sativa]